MRTKIQTDLKKNRHIKRELGLTKNDLLNLPIKKATVREKMKRPIPAGIRKDIKNANDRQMVDRDIAIYGEEISVREIFKNMKKILFKNHVRNSS